MNPNSVTIFDDLKTFHTKILEEWSKDCKLDETRLDHEAIRIPSLHSKYLNYLQFSKRQSRIVEQRMSSIIFKRQQWYDGRLSKEEMDELGWEYDPFGNQLVKSKSHKERYYDSDPVLADANGEVGQWKDTIEALEKMLSNIAWRHQSIKCALDFRKFQAGVI